MSEVDSSAYSRSREAVENKHTGQQRTAVKAERTQSTPIVQPQPARSAAPSTPTSSSAPNKAEIDLKAQLEALAVDSTVLHKKFGKGTVVKSTRTKSLSTSNSPSAKRNSSFPMPS